MAAANKTNADIMEALRDANYNKSEAARELGMTPMQLHRAIQDRPDLQHLIEEERLYQVIKSEECMYAHRDSGNYNANKFILLRKGKKEGWGEAPIEVQVIDNTSNIRDIIKARHAKNKQDEQDVDT